MPETNRVDERDVIVALHPHEPLVLAGDVVSLAPAADAAPWSDLLGAARRVLPDGAWPLGPHRRLRGLRLHLLQARSSRTAAGWWWADQGDPSWPEPLRRMVGDVLAEDSGRTPTDPLRVPWMRRDWWLDATAWVDARLAAVGRQRTGEPEPKEHCGFSAVARIPATGGAVWLKALRAAGCADRSPDHLAAELARLGSDGFELDLLDETERAELKRRIPELSGRVRALADGPLAAALVHGDFHPWNVARPAGWTAAEAVVLDWTDAAVGPAAVDLTTLVPRSTARAARAPMVQAYAEVWAGHLGIAVPPVVASVRATEPAAYVVQALAYDEILRAVEPVTRWPLTGAMAGNLRALLSSGSA